MAGTVATNDAGDVMVFSGGAWKPAPVASNDRGDRVFYDGSAWQPVPGPIPSGSPAGQPGGAEGAGAGGGSGMMRGLGLGVRDVIEGAAAIPGMAVDALSYPVRAAGRALGYPMQAPTEILSGGLTAAGLPEPETPGERLMSGGIRGAASALPTMGAGVAMQGARMAPGFANALAGGATSQVVGGFTGGAAAEGARQNDLGPLTQLGAGLAGGMAGAGGVAAAATLGRGLGAAVQPFTQAGREDMVRNVLLQSSAQPETLMNRLLQGADPERRLPGSPVTTAQQARDPGLMPLEQGLRSQVAGSSTPGGASPAARFRDVEARRNQVRTDALEGLGDGSTPDARGSALRETLRGQEGDIGDMVGAAYQSVDPDGAARFPVASIEQTLRGSMARLFGEGTGGPPPQLARVLEDLPRPTPRTEFDGNGVRRQVNDPAQVDWRFLQNLRSRLGSMAGEAAANGDRRLASAAGAAWDDIEQTARRQADQPGSSFTPEMMDRWDMAGQFRREQGNLFDRDTTGARAVGDALRRDAYGNPMMPDAKVADRALVSAADARQMLAAAGPNAEAVRTQLRGQFVERLTGRATTSGVVADASGNTSQVLSPNGFRDFLAKNRAVANVVFDPDHAAQLERLAADFAETSMANATGRARGSDTAQNLSVANFISRASNGLIDPGNPLAQAVAGLGPVMRWVYAAPEEAVRTMLTEAMVNPAFARDLLSRATPASMQRALGYVQRSMRDRIGGAIGDAVTRQGVRSVGTEASAAQSQPAAPTNRLYSPAHAVLTNGGSIPNRLMPSN